MNIINKRIELSRIAPYEFSVFALLMGTVTLLAIFLFIYPLIFRPKSRLTAYFLAMICSTIFWCLGYTLEIAATDTTEIVMWNLLQYIGIVTIAPFFLLFVLVFTDLLVVNFQINRF